VRSHVSGFEIPGAKVGTDVRSASGSVVILPGRLLASIGTHVIVDTDFRPDGGGQKLELAEDGVRIRFDVASVLARGAGSVEVHYRLPLDATVLSRVPAASGQVVLSNAVVALLNPWLGTYGGGGSSTTSGHD